MYEQLKGIIHYRKNHLFAESFRQLNQAYHLAQKAKSQGKEELVSINIGYVFDMLDWLRKQDIPGMGMMVESVFMTIKSSHDFEQLEKFIEEEFFPDFPELPDELVIVSSRPSAEM